MKRLLIAFVLLLGAGTAHATTYYISNAGADTNAGTSTGASWAHAPGMANCANTCSSTTIHAGDSIILRGGDTWTSSSMPWNWSTAGTSGSFIYIGVDFTYFSGGSWSRPIITCSGSCAKQFNFGTTGNFVQLDNLEWTGIRSTSTNPAFASIYAVDTHDVSGTQGSATHVKVSNNYFHGACIAADGEQNAAYMLGWPNSDTLSEEYNNVIDGSDQTYYNGSSCVSIPAGYYEMIAFAGGVGNTYNNYMAHLSNGWVAAGAHTFHDNVINDIGSSIDNMPGGMGDDHENGMESNADCSYVVYNNIFENIQFNGIVLHQLSPNSGCTSYSFNNVHFNNDAPNGMQCYESSGGGHCSFFNNTAQCGPTGTSTNICGRATGTGIGVWTNNHFITSASPAIAGGSVTIVTSTTQTQSTANSQGYNVSQTYAYSPTLSSNSTVTASGTNETSVLCSAVAAIDTAAGTACLKDTTYGVVYNVSTHSVTGLARTPNSRPSSGSWNTGAYQFTNSSAPPVPHAPVIMGILSTEILQSLN